MTEARAFTSIWRYRFARTRHRNLTLAAIAVGWTLSEFANWRTGADIRPGNKRVAEVLNIREDTVKAAVRQLVAAGWLARVDRGRGAGHASTFRLAIPAQVRDGDDDQVLVPLEGYRGSRAPITPAETASYRGPGPTVIGVPGPHQQCHELCGGSLPTLGAA